MQRLTEFHQDVIGHIRNVVDGADADAFEALPEPVRRWRNLHTGNKAATVSTAKIRFVDRHGKRVGSFLLLRTNAELRSSNGCAEYRANFSRDPKMVHAIRTIGGDIQLENGVVAMRLHTLDGKANAGDFLPQLPDIDRDIHELFQPNQTDLHK